MRIKEKKTMIIRKGKEKNKGEVRERKRREWISGGRKKKAEGKGKEKNGRKKKREEAGKGKKKKGTG